MMPFWLQLLLDLHAIESHLARLLPLLPAAVKLRHAWIDVDGQRFFMVLHVPLSDLSHDHY